MSSSRAPFWRARGALWIGCARIAWCTGKAAAQLKELSAGEKVTVKERNNEVYSIGIPKAKSKHHASAASHTAPSATRKD